jgi:hypothetical protein
MTTTDDPTALPLDELRELRSALQNEDDAVSFVRRVAQARLDLISDEQRRRHEGDHGLVAEHITEELGAILSGHLTGGAPRPPRPADDFSEHPLALQLEALCNEAGTDLESLSDDELNDYQERLRNFERERSEERRELFTRIDLLSAELVRRYRDGEADVDGLLAADD